MDLVHRQRARLSQRRAPTATVPPTAFPLSHPYFARNHVRIRAAKEVVAVPRGVHRSLVNRYGPRTPAIAAAKPSGLDASSDAAGAARGGAAGVTARLGGGLGVAGGLALVGSSRPLLELASCKACVALEEEISRLKSDEKDEVYFLLSFVMVWVMFVVFVVVVSATMLALVVGEGYCASRTCRHLGQ